MVDAEYDDIGDKAFVHKALVAGETLIGSDMMCLLFAFDGKSLPLISIPNLALDDDLLGRERIGDDDGFMRMLSLSVSSSTLYISIGCVLVYDFRLDPGAITTNGVGGVAFVAAAAFDDDVSFVAPDVHLSFHVAAFFFSTVGLDDNKKLAR